ncbi:hypothetical protein Vadar_029475 [Vaccinium darrowii]|uniref:Uncharacterized protein n=1 Tax=Vaccinium darrowii TaxID=229202 RepID=A0ACB7ZNS9_9ERIC|nr:hypothetical protein Vadar_029475 [Vaccinium darrowii]
MYEPEVPTDDSERTAFRRAEKKYKLYYDQSSKSSKKKKQPRPVDLSEVIDFGLILDSFNRNGELPSGVFLFPCDFDRPIFCLENRPGFYFIPRAISVEEQCHWIRESLTSFPQPPNRTNHNAIYGPINDLFVASTERKVLVEEEDISCTNEDSGSSSFVNSLDGLIRWKFREESGSTSSKGNGSKSIPASVLLRKLRWSTLGLQFAWSKRNYDVSLPHNKIPDALAQLAKKMAAPAMPLGQEFHPEAAIVNYFSLGDTLGGHLDDMEADWSKPIVSMSLGCKAIFLLGGKSRQDLPQPMFLRSGDVVLMAGEARECFHGVPRIFTDEENSELAHLEPQLSNPKDICYLEYIRTSRININIRQDARSGWSDALPALGTAAVSLFFKNKSTFSGFATELFAGGKKQDGSAVARGSDVVSSSGFPFPFIFFQEHPDLYHRLRDTVGGFLASALIIFRKAISSALVSFRKAISTALVSISSALVSLRKAISSALVTFCSTFLSIWNRLVRAVRNPTGDKTQNPVTASKVEQKAPADQHHPKAEANGGTSPTSVVVNSEPTREEQVQNAVKFLSHPKVWVSPVMYRRSFLETKGLRKEEIDEAFRRVPDARFDWSDALSVIGIAAVSLFFKGVLEKEGESAKKTNSNPSLEKEIAAAEFAQSSQEIFISKTEEKKCFEELVKEMKALSNAVQKLEAQANAPGRTHLVEEQDLRLWANSSRQQNANGMNIDLYSAKSSPPPTTSEPSAAAHSKSYMEVSFISYDRLVVNPPDAFDELLRMTKISESGGVQDVKGNGLVTESEGVVNSSLGRSGLITSAI